jgi:adenosylcobyric acid synthase
MMGNKVLDPHQVESNNKETEGLGILPVITTLTEKKQIVQRSFYYKNSRKLSKGYEIHMGESKPVESPRPLNTFDDRSTDGFVLNDRCWGSYIHGIFDNEDVLNDLLSPFNIVHPYKNYEEFKESQYDKLAALVRSSVRMDKIYDILK